MPSDSSETYNQAITMRMRRLRHVSSITQDDASLGAAFAKSREFSKDITSKLYRPGRKTQKRTSKVF